MPLVAVSACLLGKRVRYDGSHRQHALLLQEIQPYCQLLPLCPEHEMGLGTPRETISLQLVDHQVQLVGNHSKCDYTAKMARYCQVKLGELQRTQVAGFLLKARSPSCAVGSYPHPNHADGLFTAALRLSFPDLPIWEEDQLQSPADCQKFLTQIGAFAP